MEKEAGKEERRAGAGGNFCPEPTAIKRALKKAKRKKNERKKRIPHRQSK